MRAVMESMSMDTRVLETVITTSVAGLRGDLEEMGIKITEKIEVIARSLSSKISEKNKE